MNWDYRMYYGDTGPVPYIIWSVEAVRANVAQARADEWFAEAQNA